MKPALALMVCLILLPGVAWADDKDCHGKPYPKTDAYLVCSEAGWIEPIMCNGMPCDFSAAKTAKAGDVCTFSCGKDTSWHLLTVSHSGTASLVKGLGKIECEHASENALYAGDKLRCDVNHCGWEIVSARCFQ